MRIRGRVAFILVSVGAFAVGLIAYAPSAVADPPPCNPGTSTTDNKSCVNFQVLPSDPGGTVTNGSLFFHTHTNFAHPGDKAHGGFPNTIRLNLDSDFRINPGTIPRCPLSALPIGTTIAQAWARCGPGAGAAGNAYLSPSTGVSGRVSTIPIVDEEGCTLVFNGPMMNGDPTVLLYARFTIPAHGMPANCLNPATNTSGNTSIFWQVPITDSALAGFGKKLVISRLDQFGVPVDDFTAILKRGNYFQAKCSATPWHVQGVFAYTGAGQAADTSNPVQPCS